ncbi:MAG: hemolysin activation/secretion protein [Gammaproteobacteria bacterium]
MKHWHFLGILGLFNALRKTKNTLVRHIFTSLLAIAWLLCVLVPSTHAQSTTSGNASHTPPPLRFTVERFRVSGVNPLTPADTGRILAPFLGEYSGLEGLVEAADTLESAISQQGHSFHRVVLPPQTLKAGTVLLDVLVFRIGKITVNNNKHFSKENVLASLPALKPGEVPRTQLLSSQRHVANQHPSKKIELRFKESQQLRAIDAVVDVDDSDPRNLFIGLNNTGNEATGHYRATFGFQHSNVSGNDDQFSTSFTLSPTELNKVKQFGANYSYPLYALGGIASVYYTKSDVDSGTVADVFEVSGAGRFIGASYTHFLQRRGAYTHTLSASVDDKLFDNNVDFLGLPLGVDVRSRPVTLSYRGTYEHAVGLFGGHVSYARNLSSGRLNDKANYAASRFGADANWDVLRFGASADLRVFDDWLLRWRGDGQIADEPLISGEQFGVGGSRSVRGYGEREVSGDSGLFTSLEAWSPDFYEGARAIGFVDLGRFHSRNIAAGEKDSDSLASIGVGLRWFWRNSVSIEADLARTLSAAGTHRGGEYKVHFNAFYRY